MTDELPEVITFAQFKGRTAADLRKVAALLEDCAKEAEAGDMAAVEYTLTDRLGLWTQMLVIRFATCQERVAESRAATAIDLDAAASPTPRARG